MLPSKILAKQGIMAESEASLSYAIYPYVGTDTCNTMV
jgi:hypothetical protein